MLSLTIRLGSVWFPWWWSLCRNLSCFGICSWSSSWSNVTQFQFGMMPCPDPLCSVSCWKRSAHSLNEKEQTTGNCCRQVWWNPPEFEENISVEQQCLLSVLCRLCRLLRCMIASTDGLHFTTMHAIWRSKEIPRQQYPSEQTSLNKLFFFVFKYLELHAYWLHRIRILNQGYLYPLYGTKWWG